MAEHLIALIAGANKGVGFEIARQIAPHGATVLLESRNAARGEAAASRLRDERLNAKLRLVDVVYLRSLRDAAQVVDARSSSTTHACCSTRVRRARLIPARCSRRSRSMSRDHSYGDVRLGQK
jgi:NAD(P)-dependent dehydrogenase (short-subunit alcohol dehydrogenase family)